MQIFRKNQTAPQKPKMNANIFNIPWVIWFIIIACFLIFLAQNFMSNYQYRMFIVYGAFIPQIYANYFSNIFYTVISYSFMHGSFMHVAFNMLWLIAFGAPLANRIGVTRFVLFWCVCSIAAALAHFVIYRESLMPMIGASGAVSGFMGAAARYGFQQVKIAGRAARPEYAGPVMSLINTLKVRNIIVFIIVWLVFNVVVGLLSSEEAGINTIGGAPIAWVAHIGGFAAGFLLASFFDRRSPRDISL